MSITVTPIDPRAAIELLNLFDHLITPMIDDPDNLLDPEVDYSHPDEPNDLIDTEETC